MRDAIRDNLWLYFLLIGLGFAGLYSFLPEGLQYVVYYALALAALVALVVAARRREPARRRPWIVLAAALVLSIVADAVWDSYWVLFNRDAPNPSIADPFYIVGFLLAIGAFVLWTRTISAGQDREHNVDAAIVALGVAVLAWIFVIEPRMQDSEGGIAGQAVSLSYPILDLFLLATLVRLLMRPEARRQRALGLFVAGTLVIIVADVLYSWGELTATYGALESIANPGWMLWYVFWGAAALDPSMREIEDESTYRSTPAAGLTRPRFALLTSAALVAPASLLIEPLSGGSFNAIAIAMGSATLFALVIYRMRLIVRSLEFALGRQAVLQQELRHTAFHDPLTGLANRANLNLQLDYLLGSSLHANVVILFLDLDNFKDVNDKLGHAAGDQLLVSIAARLSECVRHQDTVSRIGGDEFLIVLNVEHGAPDEVAVATAERILDALKGPVVLGTESVTIGTSIGIAWPSANDLSKDRLLRAADRAMYDAKRAGKNRYGIASATLALPEQRPSDIASQLHPARIRASG